MGHGKRTDPRNNDVLHQGYNRLNEMFRRGCGTSKHQDKISGRGYDGKIYSLSTFKSYSYKWKDFCNDAKKHGVRLRDMEEAKDYVLPYLEQLKKRPGKPKGTMMSAYSIRLYFAAVAKVFGLTARDYQLPRRYRKDIKRSRRTTVTDSCFSEEKNMGLVVFCSCTGLRNKKELQALRGRDLVEREDGSFEIHVCRGKGGLERWVPVVGSPEEIQCVVARMRSVGPEELVWPHVHSAADVHLYRRVYARRVYEKHARPLEQLQRKEKYFCRKDMRGIVFDRAALYETTKTLGHKRLGVVVGNYLDKK